jgi:NADH dehydrogenase FAD-containing subunit
VTHVQGVAEKLTRDVVSIRPPDGRRIELPWDVAIVATGVDYGDARIVSDAGTLEARQEQASRTAAELALAERVLVVGGGPVGVEVAAELATDLDAEITLVHAGERLLPGLHDSLVRRAERWLDRHGVVVHTGQRVPLPLPGKRVTTAQGLELAYDVGFVCMAGRPRSGLLEGFLSEHLDARGAVQVDAHLRVGGHPRVYAVGDVTALPERKLGMYAGKHVDVVVDNVVALLRGGEGGLAVYTPATDDTSLALTLGRGAGAVRFAGITVPSAWFGAWVKGRDVFVPRYRKRVGL